MRSLLDLKVDIRWSDEEIKLTGKKPSVVLVDTLWASTAIATAFHQYKEKLQIRDLSTIGSTNLVSVLPIFAQAEADLFTAAFVNAETTVLSLLEQDYDQIIFIPVGSYTDGDRDKPYHRRSLEDYFAAAYMVRLIELKTGLLFETITKHRRLIDNKRLLLGELRLNEFVQFLLKNSKITASNVESSFIIDSCPVVCKYANINGGYFFPVS